jgi:hypothetical protein
MHELIARMKIISDSRTRFRRGLGASLLPALCLTTSLALGADFGRVSGTVSDAQGNPLVGATVLITGPVLGAGSSLQPMLARILTDAHGKFIAERLVPGWYSLRVSSATRLPAQRNGVKVEAGQTAQEKFVLSDIFAPLRFQIPPANLTTWGDDWKWVLRTSASTRPILRFAEEKSQATTTAKAYNPPLPPGQKLIGMLPGSTRRGALEGDPGMGSVVAYSRLLSADSDFLVAGEMNADGSSASSLVTALRRNLIKGDPQELTLVVHQLSLGDGIPLIMEGGLEGQKQAQALSASYSHTRRLSDSITITTGMEFDYLNAGPGAMTTRPNAKVEYHKKGSSNTFAMRYGSSAGEGNATLMERVGDLTAFPRITLRHNRPQIENLNHTEASFDRKLGKSSHAGIAVYHDDFTNTAVWGVGQSGAVSWLAGNVLPNAHVNGVTLNAGNYNSTGLRATFIRSIGDHVEAAVVFTTGEALAVVPQESATDRAQGNLRQVLSNDRSQSVAGKITARIPVSKTQITTSYQWIQSGRVTGLDPLGQANLQLEPFLGIQIRQPLPTLAFLPAHIEALADFRNLLAEGYAPVTQGGERLILTPSYRSFRGGFSVQF